MKKTYFLLGGISAIALLIVGLTTASAFGPGDRGGNNKAQTTQNPQQWQQHRQEMQNFQQDLSQINNFDEWKIAIEEHATEMGHEVPDMLDRVTANNFQQFKQMHELMQSGDKDGAQAIAKELGLPDHKPDFKMGDHMRGMFKRGELKDTNGDGLCNHDDIRQTSAEQQP